MAKRIIELRQTGTTNRIGELVIDEDPNIGYLDLQSLLIAGESVSGEQRVRLLGPFRVNWDTLSNAPTATTQTFADGWGIHLGENLPEGAVVLQVWPDIVTDFEGGDPTSIQCGICADDDPNDKFLWVNIWGYTSDSFGDMRQTLLNGSYIASGMMKITGPGAKVAAVLNKNVAPTSGAIDIYALIAEPIE